MPKSIPPDPPVRRRRAEAGSAHGLPFFFTRAIDQKRTDEHPALFQCIDGIFTERPMFSLSSPGRATGKTMMTGQQGFCEGAFIAMPQEEDDEAYMG